MQHASATRPRPGTGMSRSRAGAPGPAEVTDIIAFDEFAKFDEAARDADTEVLEAPELDDLQDTDNMPVLRLAFPRGGYPEEYLHNPQTTSVDAPAILASR